MARITQEKPDQDDIRAMLAEAEPYSGTELSADELSSDDAIVLVARNGKQLVGLGAFVMGGDRESEIKILYVAPELRKRGIAVALMAKIVDASRRYGQRWLRAKCGAGNEAALGLLRKSRFKDSPPFGAYEQDPATVFLEFAP